MTQYETILPDTSVIIERIISDYIKSGKIETSKILIHEALLTELEHQANTNREIGFIGLKEIKILREIAKEKNIQIEYIGRKPTYHEINNADSGAVDAIIRETAYEESATLITADVVQSKTAEAKGMDVLLVKVRTKPKKLTLDKFFDKTTMSAHLREEEPAMVKKGRPGAWKMAQATDKKLSRDDIIDISKEIVEMATIRTDGFIENDRGGSTIIQLGNYRIVITKPPFSDGWEITAVRPVKKLYMDDYKLSDKLKQRISVQAEGILIAGSPGAGKTTFTQALADHYSKQEKVIKTVEAPRDLDLPNSITQYAITHGTNEEVRDILLLCRPDYTIFDEMRNTQDFKLFTDLRLSGVGMIGVIHATKDIDAIQRFVGRIELGVIPQVVDTVMFIKDGAVSSVLSISMEVKVPHGMTESDLARPIVVVSDFETGSPAFELYSYGEETVVVPVTGGSETNPVRKYAAMQLESMMRKYSDCKVELVSDNRMAVYVPENDVSKIIGKGGKRIEEIEKKLGISIDVRSKKDLKTTEKVSGKFETEKSSKNKEVQLIKYYLTKKALTLVFAKLPDKPIEISIEGKAIMTAQPDGNKIKLTKKNKIVKNILNALDRDMAVIFTYT
ncbi:PINc/VapC family ATPase [Candidatus Woesearchaeota archaeon]|nr:PINc/VapC family ATPase [Candidatus Woesearchaeota archaeon]